MMLGFIVGVTRMILDFIYQEPRCDEIDDRPLIIKKVHYMYFAALLFFITIISSVIISLMTDPPEEYRLIRTTYWTRFDEGVRDDEKESFEMRRNADLQENVRLDDFSRVEGEDIHDELQEPQLIEEKTFKFYLKKFGNWFCGFNKSVKQENEFYAHLTEVASLRQDKRDKIILNCLLVVALTIPFITYLYFSV